MVKESRTHSPGVKLSDDAPHTYLNFVPPESCWTKRNIRVKNTWTNWSTLTSEKERMRMKTAGSYPPLFLFVLFFFGPTHGRWQFLGPGIESELQVQPVPQPWQCRILNPLYQARCWICVSGLPSWCQYHCATSRALIPLLLISQPQKKFFFSKPHLF